MTGGPGEEGVGLTPIGSLDSWEKMLIFFSSCKHVIGNQ